jgi:hypothetical protein
VIPPGAGGPDLPEKPIYIPGGGYPDHPIVYPPGLPDQGLPPTPGLPPLVPSHPINGLPGIGQLPTLPGFGGGMPTRPDQGLPGGGGHPSQGLPGSPTYPSQGLPGAPARPDQGLPGQGGHPSQGLPGQPGGPSTQPLPPNAGSGGLPEGSVLIIPMPTNKPVQLPPGVAQGSKPAIAWGGRGTAPVVVWIPPQAQPK